MTSTTLCGLVDASVIGDALACWPEAEWPDVLDSWAPSLLEIDPEELTADRAIDYLVELQAAQSRLAALEARAIIVAAGTHARTRTVVVAERDGARERTIEITDEAREEIATALHRSPAAVHEQITTARLLAGPLRRTRDALASGRLTAAHARAIADQASQLTGAATVLHGDPAHDTSAHAAARVAVHRACDRLQDRLLGWAADATPGQVRTRARRLVAALDTAGHEHRRQQARTRIDVTCYPETDGLGVLFARLPLDQAARIHAALDATARITADGPDGSCLALGQRRAAALLDAVCGTTDPQDDPARTTQVTTEIQVVIEAAALLGITDTPATLTGALGDSAVLTAQTVRDLLDDPACPTRLRRLVTDPLTGHLLDRGARTYAVTDAMRAFLATRDRTCRFPGCARRAVRCQIDHAHPHADGGTTTRCNLGPLCVRHHQLKTHSDWDITHSTQGGACTWTSPAGRTYTREPVPILDDPDPPPF